MKKLLILLLLNCSSTILFSKEKNKHVDSLSCLEVSGRVTNLSKKMRVPYKVELISFNQIIDSVFIYDKSEFKFMLNKYSHYAIRISKPGYASRLISVYTNVPSDINALYRFQFETELIANNASKKLDSDALDFPIAVISFQADLNNFYYSEEYTANLKRQLYLRQNF